jgi:hypothetical protein
MQHLNEPYFQDKEKKLYWEMTEEDDGYTNYVLQDFE